MFGLPPPSETGSNNVHDRSGFKMFPATERGSAGGVISSQISEKPEQKPQEVIQQDFKRQNILKNIKQNLKML